MTIERKYIAFTLDGKAIEPGPEEKLLVKAFELASRAWNRVLRDLGKNPRQAVELLAWGLNITPARVQALEAEVRELMSGIEAITKGTATGDVAGSLMMALWNEGMKPRECRCPVCRVKEQAASDPKSVFRLAAKSILDSTNDDPGLVALELAARLGLDVAVVDEACRSISTEKGRTAEPVELIEQLLKTFIEREDAPPEKSKLHTLN